MSKYKYKTELEARQAFVLECLKWCGIKEGSTEHAGILAAYNKITPLPRGHKATKTDSWCAIFMCAIGWSLGYRKWPWECSCTNIRAEAKRRGIWREGWNKMPELGDWVIYDWGNNGTMDHIGAVCAIIGNSIWVVEGNYDNAVKIRRLTIGDNRVEGFVALDFSELVAAPAEDVEALRPGDKGEDVRQLQGILRLAGYYAGDLDGSYGPQTTQAVTDFQEANGLEPDGKAGPKTQEKLLSFDFKVNEKEVEPVENNRYERLEDVPEDYKPTIVKLLGKGYLLGRGEGVLDLSEDLCRTLVMLDRAGQFD